MPAAPNPSEMLAEMSAVAYRLGMVFGGEAERAEGARQLDCFNLFDRCFFGVRVAVALQLRLSRAERAERSESERDSAETSEREGREREAPDCLTRVDVRDRDRDRDIERASLPILLNTLQSVCIGAGARPGPEPSALPSLRELLARMGGEPNRTATSTTNPSRTGLRARLATSAATPAPSPTRAPLRPGTSGTPPRRATGPPGR